jgi:hypothetical protein
MSISSFRYSYELSPITLYGGIANSSMPGNGMPIVALLQAGDFPNGILDSADTANPNDFFAHFEPAPGSLLLNYTFGEYPYANQNVAANAVIPQPKRISLIMKCPAKGPGGYENKTAVISNLVQKLDQHVQSGGTFTVATPSYIWQNALLRELRDIGSEGEDKQVQVIWQWDFYVPLLTLQQAQQAYSALMNQMSSGQQVNATNGGLAWSSVSSQAGQGTGLAGPAAVPSSTGAASSGLPSGLQ